MLRIPCLAALLFTCLLGALGCTSTTPYWVEAPMIEPIYTAPAETPVTSPTVAVADDAVKPY
ncbi:MAG: hypothetical protein GC159_19540 [Phycisphaera sp.]|nr:hypothetical protein [Phycisphaera sp.]